MVNMNLQRGREGISREISGAQKRNVRYRNEKPE